MKEEGISAAKSELARGVNSLAKHLMVWMTLACIAT
jgi:hypothetical protein